MERGERENWKEWQRGSTFYTAASESGQDLATYEKELGFDRKELQGLTVLDLGSGATEKFSRELKQAGVEADVISLNPDLQKKSVRDMVQEKADWQEKSIAATAQELPFMDQSFDRIFGLNSVTLYANPRQGFERTERWLSEVVRVLKPGGEAIVGPIMFIVQEGSDKVPEEYSKLVDELRGRGVSVEFQAIVLNEKERYNARMIIRKPKDVEADKHFE